MKMMINKIKILWERLNTKTKKEILWDSYLINEKTINELQLQLQIEKNKHKQTLNNYKFLVGNLILEKEADHKYILENVDKNIKNIEYIPAYKDSIKFFTLKTST